MLALLVFTMIGVLVGLTVLAGFVILLLKLVFGLVLLPFRLAAAGMKLLLFLGFLVVGIPLLAIGGPLLVLLAVLAVAAAPIVLVIWGISSLARSTPKSVSA